MNSLSRILNLLRKETPSPGTDYTGTVTKVENGTAYVQLAGADISDTPAKMSVNCQKGDTVRIRVNKGKAWITGNDTAPPTDDAYAKESEIVLSREIKKTNTKVRVVERTAGEARRIAGNTDQYFWHVTSGTDTGVHLTEKPQEEFLADPENGGGNLLARSNGIAIRDGLTELAQFSADGISFVDPHGVGVFDESISATSTNAYFSETYASEQFGPTESYTITLNNPYFLPEGESAEGAISIDLDVYDDAVNPPDTISETLGPIQLDASLSETMCNDIVLVEYDPDARTIQITCANQGYVSYAVSVTVEWAVRIRPASLSFGTRYGTRGAYSSTFGLGLKAERREQVAIGAYNENTYKNLFEIGMGTGDTNRRTVFSVDDDGNVLAVGDIRSPTLVSELPPRVINGLDIGVSFFASMDSPFQPVRVTAYRIFEGLIYFSIEIFINGTFIPNQTYRIGKVDTNYYPASTMSGSGHSTDGNFNPKGCVTWLVHTNGDMQILLQSTDGPYVFISGMYML